MSLLVVVVWRREIPLLIIMFTPMAFFRDRISEELIGADANIALLA
jgi:hypothetical protein